MVGNGNFGGIRISEAEYRQSHIPGRILLHDVRLYSLLLYLPYIYGDVLSISFGIVMFWAVSAYEHYEKKRYIALAACVAGLLCSPGKIHGSYLLEWEFMQFWSA